MLWNHSNFAANQTVPAVLDYTYDVECPISLGSFDMIIPLRSIETHNIPKVPIKLRNM